MILQQGEGTELRQKGVELLLGHPALNVVVPAVAVGQEEVFGKWPAEGKTSRTGVGNWCICANEMTIMPPRNMGDSIQMPSWVSTRDFHIN